MSYTTEHRRLAPVLAKARQLDIATNPAPEALFETIDGRLQFVVHAGRSPPGMGQHSIDSRHILQTMWICRHCFLEVG